MRNALNQDHLKPTGLPVRQVQPVVHRVAEVLTCAAANTDNETVSLVGWSALESSVGLKVSSVLGLLPFLHVRLQ